MQVGTSLARSLLATGGTTLLHVAIIENIILTFHKAPSGHDAVGAGWKHGIINTDWSDLVVVHKRSAEFNQSKVVALIVFGIFGIRNVDRMWDNPLYLRASYRRLIYLDVVTSHLHPNFLWAPQMKRLGIVVKLVSGKTPTYTQNDDDDDDDDNEGHTIFLSISEVFSRITVAKSQWGGWNR